MVSWDTIEVEIELLRKNEHVPQELVSFFKDLTRHQLEFKKNLENKRLSIGISSPEMAQKMKDGVHLLDFTHITLEGVPFEDLFRNICDTLEKYGPGDSDDIQRLRKTVNDTSFDIREFVRKAAERDVHYFESLSREFEVDGEHLQYLGIQTVKPFFELLAGKVMKTVKDVKWVEPFCPVCGHEPIMAALEREEGRRIFQCSLCSTEWAFRRLQCPYCLNDDHETLRFFFVDEGSPYRVDVCDACKRYIKTVDERKMEEGKEVILAVENLATIFLDILAAQEGFRNPGQYLFGIEEEPLARNG